MNKKYCFFHNADLDGHCSGAIVKYFEPDIILKGINYGDKFPWNEIDSEDIIFMVDFAIQPNEEMYQLKQSCKKLIWIDHHKSAINSLSDIDWDGFRDDGLAACELTWRYFYGNIEGELPSFIALLGRYDVWDNKNKDLWNNEILPFQKGFKFLYPNSNPIDNMDIWEEWIKGFGLIDNVIEIGKKVIFSDNIKYASIIKNYSFDTQFEGLRAIAINNDNFNSQLFDSVWDEFKYDIMISFMIVKGEFWTVSLYSTNPDIDVSIIAKKYGGGGHKGASGFQCKKLPFEVIK
jgi:uncharacterized protein